MELEMAAYGWLGDAWSEAYPEDLPPEWRLDYYGNQYDAVLVPSTDWLHEEDEALGDWLEEAADGLRLYWEVASDDAARRLLQLYRFAGTAPSGWVLRVNTVLAAEVATRLRSLAPLMLPAGDGVWRGGTCAVLQVDAEPDLRQLREAIDSQLQLGMERLVLLVRPAPRAAQTMEQIHTLCQLYGS